MITTGLYREGKKGGGGDRDGMPGSTRDPNPETRVPGHDGAFGIATCSGLDATDILGALVMRGDPAAIGIPAHPMGYLIDHPRHWQQQQQEEREAGKHQQQHVDSSPSMMACAFAGIPTLGHKALGLNFPSICPHTLTLSVRLSIREHAALFWLQLIQFPLLLLSDLSFARTSRE